MVSQGWTVKWLAALLCAAWALQAPPLPGRKCLPQHNRSSFRLRRLLYRWGAGGSNMSCPATAPLSAGCGLRWYQSLHTGGGNIPTLPNCGILGFIPSMPQFPSHFVLPEVIFHTLLNRRGRHMNIEQQVFLVQEYPGKHYKKATFTVSGNFWLS